VRLVVPLAFLVSVSSSPLVAVAVTEYSFSPWVALLRYACALLAVIGIVGSSAASSASVTYA
jgi:hypothetical protein